MAEVAEPAEVPFVVERFVFENAEPGNRGIKADLYDDDNGCTHTHK